MVKYGFDQVTASGMFSMNKLSAYDGQKAEFWGIHNGRNLKIDFMLDARDIVLLEIRPGTK